MALTRWEDWFAAVNRAFDELLSRSSEIFVARLSMGGCLALRLAELHGNAIRGLVLVNPSVTSDNAMLIAAVRVLKFFVPSVKGIASDIKKPGSAEVGYDRMPVKAVASLA